MGNENIRYYNLATTGFVLSILAIILGAFAVWTVYVGEGYDDTVLKSLITTEINSIQRDFENRVQIGDVEKISANIVNKQFLILKQDNSDFRKRVIKDLNDNINNLINNFDDNDVRDLEEDIEDCADDAENEFDDNDDLEDAFLELIECLQKL